MTTSPAKTTINTELMTALKKYKVTPIRITNDIHSPLQQYVDQIYVINMVQDIRKRNYIHVLFQKYKINYTLVLVDKVDPAVFETLTKHHKMSMPELGCTLSHMWCLIHLLKNEYKNAIIFEDDIVLSKTFVEDFIALLSMHPTTDFMLLGAHDFNFSRTNHANVENRVYRPTFDPNFPLYGAHANYYSFQGAKRMLYIRTTHLSFFDNEYNLMFDTLPNAYICYPNLVLSNMSESGISDTHKKDFCTQHEYNYYNCCFKDLNFRQYNLMYTNIFDVKLYKNKDTQSVEDFITACLQTILGDPEKIHSVKNRCALDFFNMSDILYILMNRSTLDRSKQSL